MELDLKDAASFLNVTESVLEQWVTHGRLPAFRVNDRYRFNRAQLLEWATSNHIKISPHIMTQFSSQGARPGLERSLRTGGVFYKVPGADKPSTLAKVVDIIPLATGVDRELLLQLLMARESMGSTGMGNGIAIPHVRYPIVMHIHEPSISLCFLEKPIEFEAIDGKRVNTLFVIVSPTIQAHLSLLSRLSYGLRDTAFSKVVLEKAASEDIFAQARALDLSLDAKPT